MMMSNDYQESGFNKASSDQFMQEMGIVTPQMLQETRYKMLVVFPVKIVDVECDLNRFTMEWIITFKFWGMLLKSKQKLIKRILNILTDQFPEYEITVKENE